MDRLIDLSWCHEAIEHVDPTHSITECPYDPPTCLNAGDGQCNGPAEYRMPLSGTGKSFPRCDHHWSERVKLEEGLNERYPEHPPEDWSPLDAGESWYEDE